MALMHVAVIPDGKKFAVVHFISRMRFFDDGKKALGLPGLKSCGLSKAAAQEAALELDAAMSGVALKKAAPKRVKNNSK